MMKCAAAGRCGEKGSGPGQARPSHLSNQPLPATCYPEAGVEEEQGGQPHHHFPGASPQRKQLCTVR